MKDYIRDPNAIMMAIFTYAGSHMPHVMNVRDLKVRMPIVGGGHVIMNLNETPHYQYALGNKGSYLEWLIRHNHLVEESLASFEHLMNDDSTYLDAPHGDKFIMHDNDLVIVDGVHRATRLCALGATFIPVLRKTS
jgi:hypothetical protein